MSGLFSGQRPSWTTPRTVAVIGMGVLLPLSVSGCKGIDKSQWRDYPNWPTEDASAAGSSQTTNRSSSSGSVVIEQSQEVQLSSDAGVVSGSQSGTSNSSGYKVVLLTGPDTCWTLVVDGDSRSGCGNIEVTDVRGANAGRVTKSSGQAPIQLALLDGNGQTVSAGTVFSNQHYVTVVD